MAIHQVKGFSATFVGDGTSTSFTFDVQDLVKLAGILPKAPASIFSATISWGAANLVSAALSGSTVTATLDSAPAAGTEGTFVVSLLF